MVDVPEPNGVLQWVVGVWMALSLGVFGHIYSRQEKMRSDLAASTESDMTRVWAALDNLRKEIADDRRLSSDDRARIAGSMVTRIELDRQVDKMLNEIEKIVGNRNR